jgi:hypothetical protein
MEYTVDYFLNKFSSIAPDEWYVGDFSNVEGNKFCALGHCGCDGSKLPFTEEGEQLSLILCAIQPSTDRVARINDGLSHKYKQATPKERILAALNDVKKRQQKKQEVKREDITKQLAILPVNETSDVSIKEQVTN